MEEIASAVNAHQKFVSERGIGSSIVGSPTDFQKAGAQWLGQIKSASEPAFFEPCCAWLARASKHGRACVDQTISDADLLLKKFSAISRERYEDVYAQEFRSTDVAQTRERLELIAALDELETKWWRFFSPQFYGLHKQLRLALGRADKVKPEELKNYPLLLREPGSGTLDVIAHALKPLDDGFLHPSVALGGLVDGGERRVDAELRAQLR